MKTEKFEEFVSAICKPRGVVPSREEWAQMHQYRQAHRPFAIIVGRMKKRRYIELRPYPGSEHSHLYACTLSGRMRMGAAVIYVCYKSYAYLYLCNTQWAKAYQEIVPPTQRPREVQMSVCKPYRRKPEAWSAPIPRDKFRPSPDEPKVNHYRKRCPNHGFARTHRANQVMNWLIAF